MVVRNALKREALAAECALSSLRRIPKSGDAPSPHPWSHRFRACQLICEKTQKKEGPRRLSEQHSPRTLGSQAPLHSQTDESLDEPPAERARERLPNALEAFLERCFGRSFEDGVSCPSAQNPSQALMARARESLRRAWANFLDSWFARPRVGEFYVISPQLDDRRFSLSSIGRVPSREIASPHMDQGIAEGRFTAKSPSGPTD